jgi:hypothetical protein
MLIAALLILISTCLFARLLWSLAIYALPLWVSAAVFAWAYDAGLGLLATFLVAITAAIIILATGQLLIGAVRSPMLRGLIAIAFALPPAIAGYHAAHGIAAAFGETGWVSVAMALVASAMTGATAWNGALWADDAKP